MARQRNHAPPPEDKPQRLQKILAHAGLGSRRECEEYVLQGRVTVDGKVVRELGTRVDPETATIAVDGEKVRLEKSVYYAVNKPKGYVSTNDDPAGRPRVIDLLPEVPERVYTVGRLDEDSTGLMILTNDGDLAHRLAHPRYGVEKTYRALVAGKPSSEILDKLTEGIWLSDGKVRAKRARFAGSQGEATVIELVLAEGKKREIRRMLAKLGHKVMSLTRIAIGPVVLKGLSAGEHRPLSRSEVELLRKVAAGIEIGPPRPGGQRGGRQGSRTRPAVSEPRRSGPRPQAAQGKSRANRALAKSAPGARRMPGKPAPGHAQPAKTSAARAKGAAAQPSRERVEQSKPPKHRDRPGRRIIGLHPKVAEEAGLSPSVRPPRPTARKRPGVARRPPRRVFGVRRPDEGENEP